MNKKVVAAELIKLAESLITAGGFRVVVTRTENRKYGYAAEVSVKFEDVTPEQLKSKLSELEKIFYRAVSEKNWYGDISSGWTVDKNSVSAIFGFEDNDPESGGTYLESANDFIKYLNKIMK